MIHALTRQYLRLVDRLPLPSTRVQLVIAFCGIVAQGGIAVTGSVVRVTASGLGCPTWPQCSPGSLTPTSHSDIAAFHQAIEFGNRMLTFVVVLTAAAVVLAVTRARRRPEVVRYAWLMPASTVAQAVIGGITVLTGLLWWTVAIHLLVSMSMVWLATVLYGKIAEPDDGVLVRTAPRPLRLLAALSAVALSGTLVAGTLVTGAGPHAGDKSLDRVVPRLEFDITALVHLHAELLVAYLALLIGLGFGLAAVGARGVVRTRLVTLIAIVLGQATIGIVQFYTNVPAALVVAHVAGAGTCVAATAALWTSLRPRVSRSEVVAARPEKVPAES